MSKAALTCESMVMSIWNMFLMWQNIPSSWAERAILPLLRQQKPSYCFLSPSLFRYPSFLLCLKCFIYLLFLSLFQCFSLNLPLPVAVRGEWRPSAALLPPDIWRRAETQRQEHIHTRIRATTHTVFTAEKTKTVEQKEETRNEV